MKRGAWFSVLRRMALLAAVVLGVSGDRTFAQSQEAQVIEVTAKKYEKLGTK